MRKYRNRIAHYEPIFKADLAQLIATISIITGYVSTDAEAFIDTSNRVGDVLDQKRGFIVEGRCWI